MTKTMSTLPLWIALAAASPGTLSAAAVSATSPSSPAVSQDGSKELSALVREQARLERKVRELRAKVAAIAPRYEAEGRPGAAKLLRRAMEVLDERSEEAKGRTLEELANTSEEELSAGRLLAALEAQERVVSRVVRFLEILEDREGDIDPEKNLAELRELQSALESVRGQQEQVREETQALENESMSPAQRAVQETIQQALQRQRELLAENERRAAEAGNRGAEQLLDEPRRRGGAAGTRRVGGARDAADRAAMEAMRLDEQRTRRGEGAAARRGRRGPRGGRGRRREPRQRARARGRGRQRAARRPRLSLERRA